MNVEIEKSRAWTGTCYPENMLDNWQDEIANIIQLPCVYCIHDKDTNNDSLGRKIHVHIMIIWRNNTTSKAALSLFNKLSKPNSKCCPYVEKVISVRHIYDYLIHDTDDARKKGKFQYNCDDRVCLNNFDIGIYEQLTIQEKEEILEELEQLAMKPEFMNFKRYALYVSKNYDREYKRIMRNYSGYLERITKGNFLDYKLDGLDLESANRVIALHESNERDKLNNK